jgi:hypothetical protein
MKRLLCQRTSDMLCESGRWTYTGEPPLLGCWW